jgi:hypothetical protein
MHGRYSFQSFVVESSCEGEESEVYAKLMSCRFFERKYSGTRTPCDEKSLLFSDFFEDVTAGLRSASALAESSAVRFTPTALLRKFADSICEMRAALQIKMQQPS